MASFLRPCVATGVSPLAVSCLSGATPRGQREPVQGRSRMVAPG